MKIAMVSEHASPLAVLGGVDAGGQNVHVAALSTALARRGAEVTVHTRRDDRLLPRRVALSPGVSVDHVPAGPPAHIAKDELLAHMPAFADELRRAWEHERPDLVHAHFWMSGWAALQAARQLDIPVAMTFHALGVVKRRHQGTRDTSPPEREGIERDLVHEVDRVLATCSDEVFELRRLGAPTHRVTVVPCGVDPTVFRPDGPREAPARPHRVVSVGRLVERKGVGNVIEALGLLGRDDVELVVAGGPDPSGLDTDQEVQRLNRLAQELGVADQVQVRGRVCRDELPALLRSADAVACAPWYEPFGIVPLEAMACGVPILGTAVGGLCDTVVHGQTGLLVPPRSPVELACAMGELLDDPTRRAAFGAAGVKRVRRRFTWSRVAEQTMATYHLLLARRTLTSEVLP
ncbi:MAG: putative glycosyl transferase [Frankiales bacterium]|nr:putative glycosyl transferase [Frankiales bacterium]MCW2709013.1 putative glycosyl transferase [Frankiales bacterium]